jgi:hypothetical protein
MVMENRSSRSEQIRQRRSSHRNTAPAKPRRSKGTASHKSPPVLVRGDIPLDSMATGNRRSRARRRYDIALSLPGAEIRLPALPNIRFGWRAVSFFLVALLSMALYVLWNSPLYQVQDIEITGLQRLTAREINTLINVQGEHIFTLNVDQLYTDLETMFPEFSEIDIEIGLPAQVKVNVTERIPVLVWYQNGRTMWVDDQGYAFPTREEIDAPALTVDAAGSPRISLPEDANPNQLLTSGFVAAIMRVQEIAPEGRPLVYSTDHGLGWKEKKGWTVYFGHGFENIDQKLQVYDAIEKHLKRENIKPSVVSVESVHAPYYRLEP